MLCQQMYSLLYSDAADWLLEVYIALSSKVSQFYQPIYCKNLLLIYKTKKQ